MTRCAYCGEPGTTLDHVVPKSYSDNSSFSRKYTVPCCASCNSLLGTALFHTVGSPSIADVWGDQDE